jgi:sulfite oxidase
MFSRRDFLKNASLALTAALARPALAGPVDPSETTEATPFVEGKDGMIVRSLRFLDLEMPPEFANSWLTPVSHFYVRNHMIEPAKIDASEWKLNVGGEVEKPSSLSIDQLARLEQHSVINTLECAGNGRAFHYPKVPGIQWERGAVGNASFSGPRLADILRRAGVKPTGKHVMFRGFDEAPGSVPQFIRSIPIEKALDPDTLVATHMNNAPLAVHHGFPARALVPGWIGAASCKWLAEIKVLNSEFVGNFMKPGYRYPNHAVSPGAAVNPDDTHPLTALAVKSMIAAPVEAAKLKAGSVRISGVAWAGEADIVRLDISVDGGQTWSPASLAKDQAHYAWRLWTFDWKPVVAAAYTIMSRATDSSGRVQPESAAWNPSGYLYNAIDRVKVYVQG